MYCSTCGKEIPDEAVICTGCGCMVQKANVTKAPAANGAEKSSVASVILGIVGIVFAWIFALVGHVTSIIGIVLGLKEYKASGKMTGLVLSIVGEVCSILSSIIGAVTMAGLL